MTERETAAANPTVTIDPAALAPRDAYRLLISSVVPRPIAWVSTQGADGSTNLAPFSFFNAVGGVPPVIMVSIARRRGEPKDTYRNLLETGELVVHMVDEALAEAMNLTSGDWPYGESEFSIAGLVRVPSTRVKPPRLRDAAIALEARVLEVHPVKGTDYTSVFAEVLLFHLRTGLLRENGLVDALRFKPIGRLGGNEYTTLGSVFTMQRPTLD
jgi:flavin reductase (DIM6/NTAB) family NADH-FMN oxidoreductase RutF